jgi:hypothetical protein
VQQLTLSLASISNQDDVNQIPFVSNQIVLIQPGFSYTNNSNTLVLIHKPKTGIVKKKLIKGCLSYYVSFIDDGLIHTREIPHNLLRLR